MAKMKTRTRRASLEFLGDEWKGSYVDFRRGHWSDEETIDEIGKNQKGTQGLIAMLQHMFHSGQMLDEDGKLATMTKDNIADFDNDALIRLSEAMQGGVDPKAPESSTDSSEATEAGPDGSPDSNTESVSA